MDKKDIECVSQRMFDSANVDSWFGPETFSLNLVTDMSDFKGSSTSYIKRLFSVVISTFTKFIPEIEFTRDDSSADFTGESLRVSTNPLSLTKLAEEDRLAIFFGLFIHEFSHLEFTNPEMTKLCFSKKFIRRKTLSSGKVISVPDFSQFSTYMSPRGLNLMNILEDKRIEIKCVREHPGYRKFLEKSRRFYLLEGIENLKFAFKKSSFAELSKNDRLEILIRSAVLYPDTFKDFPELRTALETEFSEVNDILNSIDFSTVSFSDVVSLAIRLLHYFEGCDSPQSSIAKKIFALSDNIANIQKEEVKRNISDVLGELRSAISKEISNKANPVPSKSNTEGTSLEDIDEVIPHSGYGSNIYKKAHISKPLPVQIPPVELSQIRKLSNKFQIYLKSMSSSLSKTRTVFMQEDGDFDEEEIANVKFSRDVFQDEEPSKDFKLEVVVLLDCSGSMCGNKIRKQKIVSCALVDAFSRFKEVSLKVYGHTSTSREPLKILDLNAPKGKNILNQCFAQEASCNNADGYAIYWASKQFTQGQHEKLLITMSDGYPSAESYGGEPARQHVREVVSKIKSKKIHVLAVAIDNFDQSGLYEDFIPYSPDVYTKFNSWLSKHLGKFGERATF